MSSNKKHKPRKLLLESMDGLLYASMLPSKRFREALDYKAQPNDVFLVTYPRCGTTWMQNVLLYIFRKGKELENMSLFEKYCPFIEMGGLDSIERMPRPGAFKTHLPYTHLNVSPEAKYIFVARNPKDCSVSFYNHVTHHLGYGLWDGSFDDFFELFMTGQVESNDYFDHLLSWYPHRNEPNSFFTTYENMKKDIKSVVISLAMFLGNEYIEAIEKDNAVLNNIINFSSFDYMRKHFFRPGIKDIDNPDVYMSEGRKDVLRFIKNLNLPDNLHKENFIRKGIVGEGETILTEEQKERLKNKFLEKTAGTDIVNWFPSI